MEWFDAIARFHEERPGVTEAVLLRARAAEVNSYEWLLEGVRADDVVLDLGCGSAPTQSGCGPKWIGLDRSASELAAAHAKGRSTLILGDMACLPIGSEKVDVVVSAMSMMLVENCATALKESYRVLRPGGTVRLLVPSLSLLTWRDRIRYARLLGHLGVRSLFPPSPLLSAPRESLIAAGFVFVDETSQRFEFKFDVPSAASLFVASLYTPGVTTSRLRRTQRLTARWAGSSLGIPLRRIVGRRPL